MSSGSLNSPLPKWLKLIVTARSVCSLHLPWNEFHRMRFSSLLWQFWRALKAVFSETEQEQQNNGSKGPETIFQYHIQEKYDNTLKEVQGESKARYFKGILGAK